MNFSYFKKLNKPITNDFILNIAASLIYTTATQIIAYPVLSRLFSSNQYGLILTLMGVANTFGVAIGNPLNNTRILLQDKYEKKALNGDFNLILICGTLLNVFLVTISSRLIIGKFDYNILGVSLISIFVLFRAYFTVGYRLVINYKKYLIASIFSLLGYILGLFVTYVTNAWVLTFIIGELISCIYIYFTNRDLFIEKISRTPHFKLTLNKYLLIMFAAMLSTIMTYMDRFFIYPFLGAEQVSNYNVASFLGKTAGIVLMPIAGVLLTYYAKESKLNLHDFYKRLIMFVSFSTIFYLGILTLGIPITRLLYPTIVDSAIQYFAIANLASTLFILGNTLQPTLLRYCESKWQPIIQLIYLITYLSFSIFGMREYGLLGFCYAVALSNSIKIIIMLSVVITTLKKEEV